MLAGEIDRQSRPSANLGAVIARPASALRSPEAMTRVATWTLRVAWVLVALFGGGAIGAALDTRSDAVQLVGAVGAWAVWAAGAVAMAVPAVATLTIVRAVVPLALAGVGVTLAAGASAGDALALALPAVLASTAAASAELGWAFVQASAYGDEQRFLLRPPLGYLFAVVVTWTIAASAVTAAPMAWAAQSWALAAVASAVAVAAGWLLPRRWHQLSRRWLVLVPAGVVVHDPVVLADTLLLRRPQIRSMRLAPADTEAADLTGPAPGTALEVATTESVTAVLAPTPAQPKGRAIRLMAFLVAPSRPGAALRAAGERRLLPR